MTQKINTLIARAVGCALAGLLTVGPAFADKGGKGHDKDDRGDRGEQRDDRDRGDRGHGDKHKGDKDHGDKDRGDRVSRVEHFGDPHRVYVHDYYTTQYRGGHCPPGLAKKHNGCMPPGQAKRWDVGQPLARDIRYYEVPAPLVLQLGQPAPGYRYVRVDDNILLLATGTRMVVDAIRGFGW